MMAPQIRGMTASDWDDVSRIYLNGIKTNLATFETQCPPYERWDASHLASCRLIIEDTSGVLGWAALSPVSSRQVYAGVAEVSIYMDEKARGKGFGVILLQALISCSEENGIWTLQASIMENNPASIRIHEKCGFRLVGYREKISRDIYGDWRTTVLMERRRSDDA